MVLANRVCLSLVVRLLTETELLNDSTIAVDIASLEVVEEGATLTYELHEAALGNVVLAVLLHVLSEVADAIGEECYLALCRTGVGGCLTISAEDFGLLS